MNKPPDRAPPFDAPTNTIGQTPPAPTSASAITHRLQSHEVMRGHNAVAIEHNGNIYRLQTTRQGKLILTK